MVEWFDLRMQIVIMCKPSPMSDAQTGLFQNPGRPGVGVAFLFVESEAHRSSQIIPGADIQKRLF